MTCSVSDKSVRAWIDGDPDPETRAELAALRDRAADDAAAAADLADRFDGTLEFGTAGLRGELGAGPNRMNRAVVIRAAAGLAEYLRAQGQRGRVVVGYDARHQSDRFAADTAAVLQAAGLEALVLPRPLPTPVLAFAIGHLDCVAGVMVTASHNPPRDNGYKVYLGDGSQIVPPADTDIAAQIAAIGSAREVPMAEGWRTLSDDIEHAYVDAVAGLVDHRPGSGLTLAYTPLHGVGGKVAEQVLQRAGFGAPIVVPEQAEPDPDFPTVAFPNPEEPGAMDLAMALADTHDADLVVANDPDADRCAVGVPTPQGWRMLHGDEVGALLADHLLRKGRAGVYATTIVSSTLLAKLAADHGAQYVETLTGFKWLGRVPGLAYAYEEALGYCVAPGLVRDKDGLSALLLVAELADSLKQAGQTLLDRLDELARTYGVFATGQVSVRASDPAVITQALSRFRESPPATVGGLSVVGVDDLRAGSDDVPPTDGVRYRLEQHGRVVVRPSGTEPKLKCYLEVVLPVHDGDVDATRIAAAGRLDALRADLVAAGGL